MEYTVQKLARLSGVSVRTLHYYDEIGLLKPTRVNSSGYRIYGQNEVDRLQQILLYRALELKLDDIKALLQSPDFNALSALEGHLTALRDRQRQLNALIAAVTKTIAATKGETTMTDNEKFEAFKQELIDQNEQKYGDEVRAKYGDDTVNASNAKLKGMSKQQMDNAQRLADECHALLKEAYAAGNPTSDAAQRAVDLHRQWLQCYVDIYCPEYHMGLGDMYVADERFGQFYDDHVAPGVAPFFQQAIYHYHGKRV